MLHEMRRRLRAGRDCGGLDAAGRMRLSGARAAEKYLKL
jgi:hypothetical protein